MSDTAVDTGARKARPLSPHLGIYKPIPTMVMSSLHRITGAALYFGTILVAWWLLAAASGPEVFETARNFF
ncbi:MAG: succinate dehydrogenase, cytochrome b556 subunit, partial [Pseudomonadota bacterium]